MSKVSERLFKPPVLIQIISTVALLIAVLVFGFEHISGYIFAAYMVLSLLTNWWATKG